LNLGDVFEAAGWVQHGKEVGEVSASGFGRRSDSRDLFGVRVWQDRIKEEEKDMLLLGAGGGCS
jgi:hypothetical protein